MRTRRLGDACAKVFYMRMSVSVPSLSVRNREVVWLGGIKYNVGTSSVPEHPLPPTQIYRNI